MKNKIIPSCLLASLFLVSCQVKLTKEKTPEPYYYGSVEQTTVNDGFPKTRKSWIAFSDRDKNIPTYKKEKNESQKDIKYLEPLMVVDYSRRTGKVKVAEFNAEALMKKISPKEVKTYGWLPEENLLLWDNALVDRKSGFILKAAIVPNTTDVINNVKSYIKNDSAVVYSSPNFSEVLEKKIPIGQLVYVYKKSVDNKGYLVGKSPSITVENAKDNIYGWVSSNMLSVWGQRSAIKYVNKVDQNIVQATGVFGTFQKADTDVPVVPISSADSREGFSNIFPVVADKENNNTKYFTNAFDFSPNYIKNVLGDRLTFTRYKEIINKGKNLNIVFVLNVSAENRPYSSIPNSIIQDLQQKASKLSYYKNIKYGAVLYKNNSCGPSVEASDLTKNYTELYKFVDDKILSMQCEGVGGQPANEALSEAGKLLGNSLDETNIVILVGSSSNTSNPDPNAIRVLSKAKAKVISYQTIAKPEDTYSNYVILAEKIISQTAANITELNKEKTADQSLILSKNNFSLIGDEKGFYYLDYPKSSMTQGFSIFPNRREENSNSLLIQALGTLLDQVTSENNIVEKSLTKYFKLEDGSNKTELSLPYKPMFPGTPSPMPFQFASELVTYDYPTLANGILGPGMRSLNPGLQKGILVSEIEYDNLRELYNTIYLETDPDAANFSQSSAISKYVKVLRENRNTLEKISKSELMNKPMYYSVAKSTGFDNSNEDVMTNFLLKGWKKDKVVGKDIVKKYFQKYKELANKLLENKNNPNIKYVQNGTTFYWLSNYFMPTSSDYELKN